MNKKEIIQALKDGSLTEAVLVEETKMFPKRAFVLRPKKAGVIPLFSPSFKNVRPSTLERIIANIDSGECAFLSTKYDSAIRATVISKVI